MEKKITGFLLLILVTFQIASASEFKVGDSIVLPKALVAFVPKGFCVMDTVKGDLNMDKLPDVILVLKTIGEDTAFDATIYKRPLLLLIGRPDQTFRLAARNDDLVYCYKCGGAFGDPYNGVEIKNGSFAVNHFGGTNERWSNSITFKYSKTDRNWYLFKIEEKSWHTSNLDEIGTITKTRRDFGRILFTSYNNENN